MRRLSCRLKQPSNEKALREGKVPQCAEWPGPAITFRPGFAPSPTLTPSTEIEKRSGGGGPVVSVPLGALHNPKGGPNPDRGALSVSPPLSPGTLRLHPMLGVVDLGLATSD